MALSTNDFGKAVVAAGLMPADALKSLWDSLPADARPKNADAFAKLLVTREKLTPFQASELLSGSGTPLVLGDYVLLAKIGAGGMGQVFKAQHRHMKRLVAIKLLPAAMTKDEAAVKRFQREVEAAAKLSHPNIVHANDASVQRGVWYLVMEYVEGRDLSATVKQCGPLPIKDAVNYITQAARGLAFAHSKGVVHRDIKPANLLLDNEGTVKILDMGLARFDDGPAAVAAAEAEEGLTQSGQVMGTVDYMAPEQAFDTRHADARADIYSLGCSLYRLLIGENVYSGDTVMQKFLAHREKPIPSLREKRPEVSEELDAVFQKMMAKLPEDRYQPTSLLVADLEACASPSGLTANLAPAQSLSTFVPKDSSGLSQGTEVEDGMTAALGNQLLRSLPDSRVAPREETDGSSAFDRTQRGGKRQKTTISGGKKPPWQNPLVLSAAGAGALLLVLLGVWVIIRDKEGKPVAKVEVPEGGSVQVTPGQSGKTAGDKSKAGKSNSVQDANDNSPFKVGSATKSPSVATSANIPQAAVVYLDDLPEKSYFGYMHLYKPGRIPKDATSFQNVFPEASPVHALMMHPPDQTVAADLTARLVYDLRGGYGSFQAAVRVRKFGRGDLPVFAEVWGDGKRLWESADLAPLKAAGTQVDVDVRGVQELTLVARAEKENAAAHTLWIEPRLTPPASSLPAASGTPVDVLALIDPAEHTRSGEWRLEKGVLASLASNEQAVIKLPVAATASYRLEADVERQHTDGNFRVGLKVGDASCQAVLDSDSRSGLSRVRNLRAFVATNPTRTDGPIFTKGQACRIVIDVTPTSVRVECDGRAAIHWKGDTSELSDDPSAAGVPNKLWLGTSSRVFKISKLIYTPVGSGQPAASSPQPLVPSVVRWPLAPSKPEDIQKLLAMQADVTLRMASQSGSAVDKLITSTTPPPAGSATIVGATLNNRNAPTTDDDLAFLAELTDLEKLEFRSQTKYDVTPAGLLKLSSLKHLRHLKLHYVGFQARGASELLQSLPELEHIHLPLGTTAEWLPAVVARSSISEVSAFRSDLTDADLAQLEKMPQLKWLNLWDNVKVTQAAIDRFAAAVPGCRIVLSTRTIEPRIPPAGAVSVVHLDDLQEKSYVGLNGLRKPGKNKTDTEYFAATFPGVTAVHSLIIHPDRNRDAKATLVYDLAGKYETFTAKVRSLDARTNKLQAEVLADGKSLWQADVNNLQGRAVEVSVDVRNVRELTLLAKSVTTGLGNIGKADTLWLEPRLTPVAASSPQPLPPSSSSPHWPFDPQDGREYVWSVPENLGPSVNTGAIEKVVGISADELKLYLVRDNKAYWAIRKNVADPFANVKIIPDSGEALSGAFSTNELAAAVERKPATGANDIWLSSRPTKGAQVGAPVRAPAPVNADGETIFPVLSADGLTLLVGSTRKGSQNADIWMFTRPAIDQPFATVERVAEPVSTPHWDMPYYVSNDRCFVIASSQQKMDVEEGGKKVTKEVRWVRYFTRSKPTESFGPGLPLGIPLGVAEDSDTNSGFRLSNDGRTIYFYSARLPGGQGNSDIWLSRRVPVASPQSPAPRPSPAIPAEALTFNGHRYLLVTSPGTWDEAKAKAEALGGHLVAINTKEERDWVTQNIWLQRPNQADSGKCYVGGASSDGKTWSWVTGEPFDITLWSGRTGPDDQNQRNLILGWDMKGRWDDWTEVAATKGTHFIIEWDTLGSTVASVNPQPTIPNSQSLDAALKFDGDGFVEIPGLVFDSAAPYTLEVVVTSPAKADKGDGPIFGFTGQSHLSYTKGGQWRWVCKKVAGGSGKGSEQAKHAISNAPQDTERTHLTCVHEGTTYRLYVNGKLFQSTDFDDSEPFRAPFIIGGKDFRGIVDELRVSKVARYKADFKPPTARFAPDDDTFSLYHFDEAAGDVLKDSSGNNHGKITGAKWVMADGSAIASVNPQPAIRNPQWNTPAFQQWMKDMAAMPADKQVEAVSKKLVELNPGFDGKLGGYNGQGTPKIENGVVTEIRFATGSVTDISPVRAFVGLKKLKLGSPSDGTGKLSDLSPLEGMKLTSLDCSYTQVSDLSPLHGMPLTVVYCGFTSVSKLAPLQGLPLIEFACQGTSVSDLSPLQGMKLTSLNVGTTPSLSDLSPLKEMPLTSLFCNRSQVSDLLPLKGMPLTSLDCSNTHVSDLSALSGMRLRGLKFDDTPASDLSPLRGMPLVELSCLGAAVSDLSPLQGMQLSNVGFTPKNVTKGMDAIRKMTSLKGIAVTWRGKEYSPEEFWKKYDAGEFGKPAALTDRPWNTPAFQTWMKDVQAMPADKQVEAVSKKLMELNPGFDGKLAGKDGKGTPKIENGVVTEIGLVTDNVTDISPVRALAGLMVLACNDQLGNRGKLSDLSPLKGMKLTTLAVVYTQVSDLSPLEAMPLTSLSCGHTLVTDLSPLNGLKLTHLSFQSTKISDLSPLAGMPLTSLLCYNNRQLLDVSPLQDCKSLTTLNIKATKVTPAQVAALQKALPNCKIEWDDPAKPKTTQPAASGTK